MMIPVSTPLLWLSGWQETRFGGAGLQAFAGLSRKGGSGLRSRFSRDDACTPANPSGIKKRQYAQRHWEMILPALANMRLLIMQHHPSWASSCQRVCHLQSLTPDSPTMVWLFGC